MNILPGTSYKHMTVLILMEEGKRLFRNRYFKGSSHAYLLDENGKKVFKKEADISTETILSLLDKKLIEPKSVKKCRSGELTEYKISKILLEEDDYLD